MQLDKTRVAIRERGILEIMDLALRVIRSHGAVLLCVLATTAVPLALMNIWWLQGSLEADPFFEEFSFNYLFSVVFWTILEVPLATAPLTLYLGRMMFTQSPGARQIAGDVARSLPQMLLYQVALRWIALVTVVGILYLATMPYMSEIILLERNPLIRTKRHAGVTTWKRSWALHARNLWIIIERTFMTWVVLPLLVLIIWGTLWVIERNIFVDLQISSLLNEIALHVALWVVVGYAAVVRFLCYVDLRIRTEGWEVELQVRSAARHLDAELAT